MCTRRQNYCNPPDTCIRVLLFSFLLAAQDAGYFSAEMAPIEVKTKKGKETVQKDEHPKPQTTLEQLAKLPAVFKKNGTVTAGNASVSTSKPWVVTPLRFSTVTGAVFMLHRATFGCQWCLLTKVISNSAADCPWLTLPIPES